MRTVHEVLPLPRALPPDVEIVAIGDIHGRTDLFDALLEAAAASPAEGRRQLVLTGDLVDRGDDSLGALEMAARAGARIGAQETVALLGNHEILMRLTLDPAVPVPLALPALEVWISNGGDAVAEQLLGPSAPWGDARRLLAALRAATPPSVAAWLEALQPNSRTGEFLFVHAGVNPHMPLEDFLAVPWDEPIASLEEEAHWAWIRGPFLDHKPDARGFSGHFVVHGHTPLDRGHTRGAAEQVERHRLNIDGGSAMTGSAKMAILRGGVAEIVTTTA